MGPHPVDDRTLWTAADLRPLHPYAGLHQGHDFPPGHGGCLFDPEPDEPTLFYWAHGRPSRTFRSRPTGEHLADHIPMGRTALITYERRGLAAGGQVLRVWPASPEQVEEPTTGYIALLPPRPGGGWVSLGLHTTVLGPGAIENALLHLTELSQRTTVPVLLARSIASISWY